METRLYIAYGSNMDEAQMAYRCPDSKIVGVSEVKNYELLFKGSMTGFYATIEPNNNKTVPVLIWKISARDEAMLDRYEGYPRFYYKKDIDVAVNGINLTAMAYIMDERRLLGTPSDQYYNRLRIAYGKFGFDMDILKEALDKSRKYAGLSEIR